MKHEEEEELWETREGIKRGTRENDGQIGFNGGSTEQRSNFKGGSSNRFQE